MSRWFYECIYKPCQSTLDEHDLGRLLGEGYNRKDAYQDLLRKLTKHECEITPHNNQVFVYDRTTQIRYRIIMLDINGLIVFKLRRYVAMTG